jgi:hypothetical protein
MKERLAKARETAEAHWNFIEALLQAHVEEDSVIEKCGFHFVEAFVHGYKHALEDMKDENQ